MKVSINQIGGFYCNKKLVNKLFKVIGRMMPSFSNNEVSVALVDNRAIKRLNKKYRRQGKVTDVLSFAEIPEANKIKPGTYLGEIIIAYPYAKVQAKKRQHSISRELAILLAHGFLHLVGFDHLNKKDEQKMRRLEKTIIERFEKNK